MQEKKNIFQTVDQEKSFVEAGIQLQNGNAKIKTHKKILVNVK